MRQIAIETALQNWKQDFEIAKLISEKTNRPVSFSPLDAYIIHMFQLAELMSNKRLTAENINSELTRIRAVTAAVTKTTKE